MIKTLILLADRFEIIEAMAPIDVFRRAGFEAKTVSITCDEYIKSSNGTFVKADICFDDADFENADLLYLPGGYPGYENLCKSQKTGQVVKNHYSKGKLTALICGAPTVLKTFDIAAGKKITSHSCCKQELLQNYIHTDADIEHDGNLYTCIGAGHSIDFALTLTLALSDKQTLDKVKKGMELK